MSEVRVVAGAIVVGGRVFAARRGPQMKLPGLWELPGGKVEAGEDDREALVRELLEELGVEVCVGERLAQSVFAYPHVEVRLVAYACSLRAGEVALREHDAVRWLAAGELGEVEWAPADVPLLGAVAVLLA